MLFSSRMISEVVQPFWEALQRGEFITDAAESVGSYRVQGRRWIVAAGGVRPRRGRDLQGRYLSFSEREEIAVALAAGESIRAIARRLGRSPSTVSRELRRNAEHRVDYRARTAALNARSGRSVQPLSGRDSTRAPNSQWSMRRRADRASRCTRPRPRSIAIPFAASAFASAAPQRDEVAAYHHAAARSSARCEARRWVRF